MGERALWDRATKKTLIPTLSHLCNFCHSATTKVEFAFSPMVKGEFSIDCKPLNGLFEYKNHHIWIPFQSSTIPWSSHVSLP